MVVRATKVVLFCPLLRTRRARGRTSRPEDLADLGRASAINESILRKVRAIASITNLLLPYHRKELRVLASKMHMIDDGRT